MIQPKDSDILASRITKSLEERAGDDFETTIEIAFGSESEAESVKRMMTIKSPAVYEVNRLLCPDGTVAIEFGIFDWKRS